MSNEVENTGKILIYQNEKACSKGLACFTDIKQLWHNFTTSHGR